MSETAKFRLPLEAIRAYCKQRPIRRLSLFGSALRTDFGPDSDIDMLIEYAPEAKIDAYAILRQQADLCNLIGRPVDLGTPQTLSPYIRQEVIDSAEPLYDVDGIYPCRSKPMPKMPDKDRLRLLHMRDASEDAINIARGYTRAEIEKIKMLQLALVKAVEVIGEAANHVSAETRAQAPDIDWGDIVGMRNNLVHAYWKVNYDVLWEVITYKLPPLVIDLKRLIDAKYGAQND
jgi:uncharacterized protein with HEPN domain/predicted nucleotidyltransferase